MKVNAWKYKERNPFRLVLMYQTQHSEWQSIKLLRKNSFNLKHTKLSTGASLIWPSLFSSLIYSLHNLSQYKSPYYLIAFSANYSTLYIFSPTWFSEQNCSYLFSHDHYLLYPLLGRKKPVDFGENKGPHPGGKFGFKCLW